MSSHRLLYRCSVILLFVVLTVMAVPGPKIVLPSHHDDGGYPVIALKHFSPEEEALIKKKLNSVPWGGHTWGVRPFHYIPWSAENPITEQDIYAIASHERERYILSNDPDAEPKWQRSLIFVTGGDERAIGTRWTSNRKHGARLDGIRLRLEDVGTAMAYCLKNDLPFYQSAWHDNYVFDKTFIKEEPVPPANVTLTALRKLSSDEIAKLKDTILHDAGPDATVNIIPWNQEHIATRDEMYRICKTRVPNLGDRKTRFYNFFVDGLLQHSDGTPQILVAWQKIDRDDRSYRHKNKELHLTRLATVDIVPAWNNLVVRQHDRAEDDWIVRSYDELVPNPDGPFDFTEDSFAVPVLLLSQFTANEQRQIRSALDEPADSERDELNRRTTYIQFATDKDVTIRELVHFFDGDPPYPSTSTPRFSTRPDPFIAVDRAFLATHKALVFTSAHVWYASTGEEMTEVGYDFGHVAAKNTDRVHGNLELANMGFDELMEMEEGGDDRKRAYFPSRGKWALREKAVSETG